jgi:hypothetical protein
MGRLYIEPTNSPQISALVEQASNFIEPTAPVEIIKEIPVEVIKEVPVEVVREVEVVKEVPIEVIKEVIKEVPVEVIKEIVVEVPVEVIKEVPVEKIIKIENMDELNNLRFELQKYKRKNKILSIGLITLMLLTMIMGAINV